MTDIDDVINQLNQHQQYDIRQQQLITSGAELLSATEAQLDAANARIAVLEAAVTPTPTPTPVPASDTKLGATFNYPVGPSKVGAGRIYDYNDDQPLRDAVAHGVTRISLSSKDDTKVPATVVSRIKSVFSRYPQIKEIDYAHNNEADRTDHRGGSDADMTAWANECKAIFAAIKLTNDFGTGRAVKTAVDMTRWGTKNGISQKMMQKLKDIGALPDVYGSSMYGPGRDDNPATKDLPQTHLGICIDVAVQFGVKLVSCYEIACPLSTNYDRPTYVATWALWAVNYAKSKGVQIRDFDYWNGMKAGGVDNRFQADGSTATTVGKTEKAFFASLASLV